MSSLITNATSTIPNATAQAAIIEAGVRAQLSTSLGLNLGPFILGLAFDCILFGVMLHQLIRWFAYGKQDQLFVKIVLACAVILTTATTCFGVTYIFHLFVYGFGTFTGFVMVDWLEWYAVLDALTTFCVEAFYLQRAYKLKNGSIWILVIVIPMMLAALAGGIAARVAANQLSSLAEDGKLRKYVYLYICSMVGADLVITSFILHGLWQSRTGWSQTDRLVNRLLRMSVESQIPSTLLAVAIVVNYSIKSDSLLIVFWLLWHPKCYVVSLLAVLNSRFSVHNDGSSTDSGSSRHKSNHFSGLKGSKQGQETVQLDLINIDTQTFEELHETPPIKIGLNRQPIVDEELALGFTDDSSQMGLTGGGSRTRWT